MGQGEERRTGQHRPNRPQPLTQYRQQHPPEQGFLKKGSQHRGGEAQAEQRDQVAAVEHQFQQGIAAPRFTPYQTE